MAFNMFPFTNLHNLNTDWILKTVKELKAAAETAAAQVQQALENAVLYTSQNKDVGSRKTACGNIHAVSYDSTVYTSGEQSQARSNIGAAATSDIPDVSDVIRYSSQTLSDAQKSQARSNIGAAASSDIPDITYVVKYTEQTGFSHTAKAMARQNIEAAGTADILDMLTYSEQSLTSAQKAQARTNIGAISASDIPAVTGAVQYDLIQSLTDSQKNRARTNIGAAASGAYLRYDAQSLTAAQKAQARQNIGVSGNEDMPLIATITYNESDEVYECDMTASEILTAYYAGRAVILAILPENSRQYLYSLAAVDIDNIPSTISAYFWIPAPSTAAISCEWWHVFITQGTPDTLTVTQETGRLAPASSISDNGKILTVSSGRPAWVSPGPSVVSDQVSTSITLAAAAADTIYEYGELSALTITALPASGDFIVRFTSGSTATTTDFPVAMKFPTAFAAEANTRYEINCSNGYALVVGWPTT